MIEPFDDLAPSGQDLTDYDRSHVKLYMRLLDAVADGVMRFARALHRLDQRVLALFGTGESR